MNYIHDSLRDLAQPIDTLNLDPSNARMHDEANIGAIQASLAQFGQRRPAVVQKQGMIVRAGNGMIQAAKNLGWTHVAAIVVDEDNVSATAYAIADNRTAELAAWDEEALGKHLQALLDLEDFDHLVTGFTNEEIEALIDFCEPGEFDEDEVPEPPDDPVTRPGDLWILGEHRLLCGDSSSSEDLDRLLAGAPIHLVNMDPPYNVKVEPRSNNAIAAGITSFSRRQDLQCERSTTERGKKDRERLQKKMHHQKFDKARHPDKKATHAKMRPKDRPLENDFLSDEDFEKMLRAWFGNAARALIPGGAFYIWGGYANIANYPPALKDCGFYFSQGIVWDKEHPVLTRKDFMGAFELSFYGWKEGAGHRFFGPTNVTDLWHVKKISPQKMVHLTEKPVELATRAIAFSSKRGEHVLDLFGGSGSTLIGAQVAERRAFVMEIDAAYCDVIVERWQAFTGQDAVLETTHHTFSDTKNERS